MLLIFINSLHQTSYKSNVGRFQIIHLSIICLLGAQSKSNITAFLKMHQTSKTCISRPVETYLLLINKKGPQKAPFYYFWINN